MPETLKGNPTPEQTESPLWDVVREDEARLLELAKAKGIEDREAYTLSVVAVAGIPCKQLSSSQIIPEGADLSEDELEPSWTVFTSEELKAESDKVERFVYDEEKSRLVFIGPPVSSIIEKIKKLE